MRNFYLIYLTSALLSSTSVNAQYKAWNGPYLGLIAGYESGTANFHNLEGGDVFLKQQSIDGGFKGLGTGIVAGWNKTFGRYYLGLEASMSLHNSKGETIAPLIDGFTGIVTSAKTRVQRRNTFELAVRGGYKIHEKVLIYAKLGGAMSKFNLRTSHINPMDPNMNYKNTFNKHLPGINIGLGSEVQFNPYCIGRLEVSHLQYLRKNFGNASSHQFKTRFEPQSLELKAGIIIPLKW
jgi:opacity protein-like surface antigen